MKPQLLQLCRRLIIFTIEKTETVKDLVEITTKIVINIIKFNNFSSLYGVHIRVYMHWNNLQSVPYFS